MDNIKENERALPSHRGIDHFGSSPALTGAALELLLGLCAGERMNGYNAIDLIAQTCHEFQWGALTKRASYIERFSGAISITLHKMLYGKLSKISSENPESICRHFVAEATKQGILTSERVTRQGFATVRHAQGRIRQKDIY